MIEATDVEALARGCAVLGTGGGGEVATDALIARQALRDFGPVRLVTLDDLPDDGILMPVGGIGAPSVGAEKLGSGQEVTYLRDAVEQALGAPVVALMASEIGGGNGLFPLAAAARTGLPVVDADAIGRAFPEVHMVSMNVAGLQPELIVVADERRNVVLLRPVDGRWAERLARAAAEVFGGAAAMADYVMTVGQARGAVIEGSVTRALQIGRAVDGAADPVAALVDVVGAIRLVEGKVVDVERHTAGGFVRGSIVVEGYGADAGRYVRVEVQNENLVALEDGTVLAIVPDLITLVDSQTADAIATERVRYGQRVVVIAFPSAPIWRTAAGIEIAGPRAFGYDIDFVPVEGSHAAHA
ncbi:DUF917 domain-containing protein [Phycicoccus sp. Soil803]|nr:DUF917 domain-containing protein [Phycicoccus sp. Soil803]KRF26833.1 hypothetical protein ASG95_11160 [Phycicoccus sp. Soil803]KRF30110.1 hypothetical protein ASG91_02310 [Phycicoccus sp. Soil802]